MYIKNRESIKIMKYYTHKITCMNTIKLIYNNFKIVVVTKLNKLS